MDCVTQSVIFWVVCFAIFCFAIAVTLSHRPVIGAILIVLLIAILLLYYNIPCKTDWDTSETAVVADGLMDPDFPKKWEEASKSGSNCSGDNTGGPDTQSGVGFALEPQYPPNTREQSVLCATRDEGIGAAEQEENEKYAAEYNPRMSGQQQTDWHTAYDGPEEWISTPEYLNQLAKRTVAESRAQTIPDVLPETCSDEPLPCDVQVNWEPSFIGCSSTFVPSDPPKKTSCADPRAWQKNLNEVMLERSLSLNDEWDLYKHYNARQKFMQFIAKDLVYRRDKYSIPIGNIADSKGNL